MTRTEYQERAIAALTKVEHLTVTGKKVAAALWIVVLAWTWFFRLGAQGSWSGVVASAVAVAALFFGVFWPSLLWKPVSREYGLVCPDCGASLLRPKVAFVAVLAILDTGKCQRCGADVVTGDEPPPHPLTVPRRLTSLQGILLWSLLFVVAMVSARRVNREFCDTRYAAARSADDTADVSDLSIPLDLGRNYRRDVTCGDLRR